MSPSDRGNATSCRRKADLNQAVDDWLNRPGQVQRPPFGLWARLDSEQRQATDLQLAQNAAARSADLTVLSDADPELIQDGQRVAQARRGGSSTRGPTGEDLTPMQMLRLKNFSRHLEAIREIEPNNRELSYIAPPGWIPTESQVAGVHEELIRAQQRKIGAIDTQESRIGIGRYAKGSIPARSPARDFTEEERAAINELGYRDGCHTCGIKNPGTPLGNFIPDHQRPTRVNPPGQPQRLYPQCLSCSRNQGLGIAQEVKREER